MDQADALARRFADPTMLAAAGLPLQPKRHLDGVSLAGLLRGEDALQREAIYWEHEGNRAVRVGD